MPITFVAAGFNVNRAPEKGRRRAPGTPVRVFNVPPLRFEDPPSTETVR